MLTSENTEQIFKAYVKCSPELKNIAKDSKGYGYDYTSLEKLIEHTKPILSEHELSIIQMPTGNGVITRMIHSSGEWIEQELTSNIIQLKGMNEYQVQGSQITYLRRYAWASICGIASDDDMDASGEQIIGDVKVSAQDAGLIKELLIGTKTDQTTFLGYYKVKAISDLSQSNATDAIQKLQKKKG